MKKLLAIAFFGLIGTSAFAQTSQGTVVLSGSFGFSKTTSEDGSSSDYNQEIAKFNIMPAIGYFLQDGLEAGASVGISTTSVNQQVMDYYSSYDLEQKNTTYSFSPYLKKYFALSEKVAFTGTASAGITKGKTTSTYNNNSANESTSEESGYSVNIIPGITFFPTEKIGIGVQFGALGYSQVTINPENRDEDYVVKNYGLDLNTSTLGIGFSYYIAR